MSVIYVLIPIAILLTAIGIYLFFWAVKTEQFDDLEKQGMSILFEDDNDKKSIHQSNNATPITTQIDKKNTSQGQADAQVKKNSL
jgi:cbb3-type cytochrome oxidase maturation protein